MWRYAFLVPAYVLSVCLPLAFSVGRNLEYEYALISSYLLLFFVPLAAILTPSPMVPFRNGSYAPYRSFDLVWIFFLGPLVIFFPASILFFTELCPCSPAGYLFWMVIGFVPGWVFAHAIYHGILNLRCSGASRFRVSLGFVVLCLAIFLGLAAELWFYPQKRAVNLLFGFLHGPIYDDLINIDLGIVFARTAHLLLAAFLLSIAWLTEVKARSFLMPAVLLFSWLATSVTSRNFPSTGSGKKVLDELLSGTLRHEDFTLHYQVEGEEPRRDIQWIYRETLFHIAELKKLFKKVPHVHVYVYPDREAKKLWFGGGATDITDVVTPSIHITPIRFPHPTLRHELVHALSSEFSFHGLGFHPNMAFTEGLAVALAPEERDLGLHEGAAALLHSKKNPNLKQLFSPFFWRESSNRAYTMSGSIIAYLIDVYGIDKVKRLYAGEDWDEVFEASMNKVLREWRKFVGKDFDEEKNALYAEALYRYPGVLLDLCPHSKADLSQSRAEGMFVRLRQPVGWDPVQDYWPWRVHIDPSDRYALVSMWSDEIRKISERRVLPEGRLSTWREAVHRARLWPPKTIEDVELAILESDIIRVVDDRKVSLELLQQLSAYMEEKRFGSSLLRQIQARIKIEENLEATEALPWRKFLAGWKKGIPGASKNSEAWILSYLRLRNGEKNVLDVQYLRTALNAFPAAGFADSFYLEWYKFLGHRLMQLHDFQDAAIAYKRASEIAPRAVRDLYQLFAREAEFFLTIKELPHG